MFDRVTEELIQQAPELQGVEPEQFPQFLTRIHAWLSVLRLGLTDVSVSGDGDEEDTRVSFAPTSEWPAALSDVRRLANTYETYAVSIPEIDYRGSSAYVSATAHQLLSTAESVGLRP